MKGDNLKILAVFRSAGSRSIRAILRSPEESKIAPDIAYCRVFRGFQENRVFYYTIHATGGIRIVNFERIAVYSIAFTVRCTHRLWNEHFQL